ncbi:uncharacterized protein EKO05_0001952 [Ascochyta rabiei]|nr:uncharacterized protein EKO05_0001952 [Ascochyta rabiei]UPX11346.1 hypothetical protein EKO05_0001952 [Ascochyta rabiei]
MPEPNIITIQPKLSEESAPTPEETTTISSPGTIAGVTIGASLLVFGIVLCLWLLWRKRRDEDTKKCLGTFQVLQGHGKIAPGELAVDAKAELDGTQNPAPEVYSPPKPHELAHGVGENVRVEIFAPPVMFELAGTVVNRR